MEAPKVPTEARMPVKRASLWPWIGGLIAFSLLVPYCAERRSPPAPPAPERVAVAKLLMESTPAIRYAEWRDDLFIVVLDRATFSPVMPDGFCNVLRAQGVRGYARVEVREASAFLNQRREVLGDAGCALPH